MIPLSSTAEIPPRRRFLRRRVRRGALVAATWVFGVSTTILLIGLWGRVVAADGAALEASTRAVLEAEEVSDRVAGWITEGLNAAGQLAPAETEAAVAEVLRLPATQAAVDSLIEQAVRAALAPPGSPAEIDVAAAIEPLAPVIAGGLRSAGLEVPLAAVEAALDEVSVLVLDTEEDLGLVGAAVEAQTVLTRVVVTAGAAMLAAGAAVVALAEERARMVRSLLIRVTVSAMTFAVVLRLGAWAVDPRGGRSPVAAGGSVLLRSNSWVMVLAAAATASLAGLMWLAARRRRLRFA